MARFTGASIGRFCRHFIKRLLGFESPRQINQPQTHWSSKEKSGPVMKKSGKRDDEYPAVHSWNYITVEGYCMLNMEFGMFKDRYICELKTDGSFKRKKNDRYDPTKKPDSIERMPPLRPVSMYRVSAFCMVRSGLSRTNNKKRPAPDNPVKQIGHIHRSDTHYHWIFNENELISDPISETQK